MIRKIKGVLHNQIRNYMHPKFDYVLANDIQGSKMIIKIDKDISTNNYTDVLWYSKIYEKATTEYCKRVIKEGDVVIDVGANLGYFTLLFSKLVGESGQVHAFEPSPLIFKLLKKNVELNGYTNVILHQKAVSNENTSMKFYINKQWHSWSSLQPRKYTEEIINVDVVTLDSLGIMPDLIKMDTEGVEYSVLCGMQNILEEQKVLKLVLEFHPEFSEFNARGIFDILEDFNLEYMDKNLIASKF